MTPSRFYGSTIGINTESGATYLGVEVLNKASFVSASKKARIR